MTDRPDEPYRPADQPLPPQHQLPQPNPAVPDAHRPAAATTTTAPGFAKRVLQFGAVGVAGLVAGSALTFAVTANGDTTGGNTGPGSGQFRGQGRDGAPGYFPGGGQGQNGQTQGGQGTNEQGTTPDDQAASG